MLLDAVVYRNHRTNILDLFQSYSARYSERGELSTLAIDDFFLRSYTLGITPAEIIAIAKIVCAVAAVVCPFIQNYGKRTIDSKVYAQHRDSIVRIFQAYAQHKMKLDLTEEHIDAFFLNQAPVNAINWQDIVHAIVTIAKLLCDVCNVICPIINSL